MKTKNNIQKTAFKSVMAATGLAMLSLTLNAQDSLKSLFENNGTNHMALAAKTNNDWFKSNFKAKSFFNTNTFAAYLAEETEEPLHLEDWMTKESNFNANSFSLEVETEEELNLEDWMLDEKRFNGNQNSNTEIEVKVNSKVFSTSTFFFKDVVIESKLSVEDWMINPKVWIK